MAKEIKKIKIKCLGKEGKISKLLLTVQSKIHNIVQGWPAKLLILMNWGATAPISGSGS